MIRQPIRNISSNKQIKPRVFDALIEGEEVYIEVKQAKERELIRLCDVVYVSGKLAGEPGVVVSVTTKFRIHTSDYERVLSLLDLTIHGSFTRVRDKMVSFDQMAITPEQFGGWVTPPEDPKKKKDEDEDEDEVISGEGFYRIVCQHCGTVFESYGKAGRKYCSRSCYALARKKVDSDG